MRETGKTKKIKGYKEIVTYGLHPYKIPITDSHGVTKDVEFRATLKEMVPDHTSCNTCGKYLSKLEVETTPHMISCDHEKCRETKINNLVMTFDCDECGGHWAAKPNEPYWTPYKVQEYLCFECYGDIFEIETGLEITWHGIRL
jgi:hypothetical protein